MTSNMKKVVKKGYTLTVTSWENDGDNYKTKSTTLETKEEALIFCELLINLLTSSDYDGNGGVGNQADIDDNKEYTFGLVYNYMKSIPYFQTKLLDLQKKYYTNNSTLLDVDEILCSNNEHYYIDHLICYFKEIVYEFVGDGDFELRVVENISLTYSHEDIEVEEVFKFDNNAGV